MGMQSGSQNNPSTACQVAECQTILGNTTDLLERLDCAASRLNAIADRIVGPVPCGDECNKVACPPAPSSLSYRMNATNAALELLAVRLNSDLDRINRFV